MLTRFRVQGLGFKFFFLQPFGLFVCLARQRVSSLEMQENGVTRKVFNEYTHRHRAKTAVPMQKFIKHSDAVQQAYPCDPNSSLDPSLQLPQFVLFKPSCPCSGAESTFSEHNPVDVMVVEVVDDCSPEVAALACCSDNGKP